MNVHCISYTLGGAGCSLWCSTPFTNIECLPQVVCTTLTTCSFLELWGVFIQGCCLFLGGEGVHPTPQRACSALPFHTELLFINFGIKGVQSSGSAQHYRSHRVVIPYFGGHLGPPLTAPSALQFTQNYVIFWSVRDMPTYQSLLSTTVHTAL